MVRLAGRQTLCQIQPCTLQQTRLHPQPSRTADNKYVPRCESSLFMAASLTTTQTVLTSLWHSAKEVRCFGRPTLQVLPLRSSGYKDRNGNSSRAHRKGRVSGCSLPPQNPPKRNVKKHTFFMHDDIRSFTWFPLQPKSAIEIG
jgi:hypothetical protein